MVLGEETQKGKQGSRKGLGPRGGRGSRSGQPRAAPARPPSRLSARSGLLPRPRGRTACQGERSSSVRSDLKSQPGHQPWPCASLSPPPSRSCKKRDKNKLSSPLKRGGQPSVVGKLAISSADIDQDTHQTVVSSGKSIGTGSGAARSNSAIWTPYDNHVLLLSENQQTPPPHVHSRVLS